jgi:hypothetical protein
MDFKAELRSPDSRLHSALTGTHSMALTGTHFMTLTGTHSMALTGTHCPPHLQL